MYLIKNNANDIIEILQQKQFIIQSVHNPKVKQQTKITYST